MGGRPAAESVVANPMCNQDWFTKANSDNAEIGRFPPGFPGKSSACRGWVQPLHARPHDRGRTTVVLDTGAASCRSGSAGTNKEKTVRQYFVDHDLIESVLYLPEKPLLQHPRPRHRALPEQGQAEAAQGTVFLVNASEILTKGDPVNFIADEGIRRFAATQHSSRNAS